MATNIEYQLKARDKQTGQIVSVSDVVGGIGNDVIDPSVYLRQERAAIFFEARKADLQLPVLALVNCLRENTVTIA